MLLRRLNVFDSQSWSEAYSHEEILHATNHFSDENVITEGASGKVYKVNLLNLTNLAVRRFDCKYGQGDELQTEISMIRRLQNKNIVSVRGVCDDNNEQIIVYEQAFHGTLDQHLSDPTLTWPQRLQICLGVAQGLNHIHYDVIHCDINSSKIFLDEDWEPKIYGFELSTEYPQSWMHGFRFSHHFGTNNMTPKYDVYCFGVLLLQVVRGTKQVPTDGAAQAELEKINDPNSWKQMDKQSLTKFKVLASKCLNQQPDQRPNMDQIVKELQDMQFELQWRYEMMDLLMIPLSEIKQATGEFNDDYVIGYGAYGKVYKANLDVVDIQNLSSMEGKHKNNLPKINKTVAIKRIINRKDGHDEQGFLTEIKSLTRCEHRNIISFLGFSREAGEMIIVSEFAFNGNLNDYLTSDRVFNLHWTQRIQICLDIANGINYIHTKLDGKTRIIHRDIKSDNILLDENLNAKIADFGLSKIHDMKQETSTIYSKNIAGTLFYLDPEYLKTGKYKRESDTYSFGVVLFEVLSGKVAYDSIYINDKNDKGLAPIARQCFNDGTIESIIDPSLKEEIDEDILTSDGAPNKDSLKNFLKIAYQCLGEAAERPTMGIMIKELDIALDFQEALKRKLQFSLEDIKLGTNNFSEKNCVASGRFWKEYKVFLQDINATTTLVAKRWDHKFGEKDNQFRTEVNILFKHKHENVIGLLGYCNEMEEKIILYEHMSKRSLDKHLKDANLTWTRRLEICIDVAKGLNFLHQGEGKLKKVIHSDVKSSSILLNDDWKAKICNLEMSSVGSLHMVNPYATLGYLDPHHRLGYLTEKSDIYSFGVVLFEILCGRLAWADDCMDHFESLGPLAKRFYEEGKLYDQMVFEGIKEQINMHSLKPFAYIACKCLHDLREERPTASQVLTKLNDALYFQKKYEDGVETPELNSRGIIIHEGKVRPEENSCLTDVQQAVKIDLIKQLQTNDNRIIKTLKKLFTRGDHKFSANATLYASNIAKLYYMKPSFEFSYQKVAEILSTQQFCIKFKIKSNMLSENTEYGCYIVFKLSKNERGLHSPVMVQDQNQRKNKHTEVVYFRSPSPRNINDFSRFPQERIDGWMEVCVWKFKSDHDKLRNSFISMNLKFASYEGTMSGLIICSVELHHM
ncbi:hypothetical protein R6Q57_026073 [Mikania cordata]